MLPRPICFWAGSLLSTGLLEYSWDPFNIFLCEAGSRFGGRRKATKQQDGPPFLQAWWFSLSFINFIWEAGSTATFQRHPTYRATLWQKSLALCNTRRPYYLQISRQSSDRVDSRLLICQPVTMWVNLPATFKGTFKLNLMSWFPIPDHNAFTTAVPPRSSHPRGLFIY